MKNLVTYKQAVSLNKLGFRETCFYHYNNQELLFSNSNSDGEGGGIYVEDLKFSHNIKDKGYIDAPTLHEANRWLLDNKNFYIEIYPNCNVKDSAHNWRYIIHNFNKGKCKTSEFGNYNTPEDALSAGLNEYLKI